MRLCDISVIPPRGEACGKAGADTISTQTAHQQQMRGGGGHSATEGQ